MLSCQGPVPWQGESAGGGPRLIFFLVLTLFKGGVTKVNRKFTIFAPCNLFDRDNFKRNNNFFKQSDYDKEKYFKTAAGIADVLLGRIVYGM